MQLRSLRFIAAPVAALVATLAGAQTSAPAASSGYSKPPRPILEVMHAPSPPVPVVSPAHDRILLVSWQDYPSITRVATPYLRLAGVRVEPGNHSKHDTPGGYGITPCARGYEIVQVADGKRTRVELPPGACPNRPVWNADGSRFVFENIGGESVELWLGDAKTGVVRRVPHARLNPMLDDEAQWMPDQQSLLVKLVPDGLGRPPGKSAAPAGPSIQESTGEKGQSSTYETRDTLNNAHDEDLFDYYATSQLAIVDARTGAIAPVGKPDRYESVDPAYDGRHVLVTTLHKPYSYITTFDRFPREVDVWDVSKRSAPAVHHVASLALADRVPIRGVRLGPRDFAWRATDPATLIWAEALDGGDWNVKVPARDKVMLAKAPFDAAPVEIARTEQRYGGISFGERPNLALLEEFDVNRHWRRTFVVDVDDPKKSPRVLWDLSSDEKYADPGKPVSRQLANGAWVVQQEGDSIFLRGMGASTQGDRPFLDRLDLATLKSERLFRSDRTSRSRGPDRSRSSPGTNRRRIRPTRSSARWARRSRPPPERPDTNPAAPRSLRWRTPRPWCGRSGSVS
jgi:dipeptidyl aminopeptidase/acylaminoacyl peptidase